VTHLEILAERFPDYIAKSQAAWERRQQIRRAFAARATYKGIAATVGLSTGRIQQLGEKGWQDFESGRPSPAERYQARDLYCAVQAVALWGRHATTWSVRPLPPPQPHWPARSRP
jgi:hypothetical protein